MGVATKNVAALKAELDAAGVQFAPQSEDLWMQGREFALDPDGYVHSL